MWFPFEIANHMPIKTANAVSEKGIRNTVFQFPTHTTARAHLAWLKFFSYSPVNTKHPFYMFIFIWCKQLYLVKGHNVYRFTIARGNYKNIFQYPIVRYNYIWFDKIFELIFKNRANLKIPLS